MLAVELDRDEVRGYLRKRWNDRSIARHFGVERQTVAEIREEFAAQVLAEMFASLTVAVGNGHLEWTGRQTADGTGRLNHQQRTVTARRAAFFLRHGRWAERRVLPTCDNSWCVAPAHTEESETRLRARSLRKAVDDEQLPAVDEPWQAQAPCSKEPQMWEGEGISPSALADVDDARAICRTACPAQAVCLESTLRAEEGMGRRGRNGIRGGLDGNQRYTLARQRRRRAQTRP